MAIKMASTRLSLNGVRNGEATPVAIIVEPAGINSRSGAETKP